MSFLSLSYTYPDTLPDTFKKYRGILLDVDGTLADSNLQHATTWQKALHEAHYEVTLQAVYEKIGKGSDWLLPELTGLSCDSTAGQAIIDRQSELFLEQLNNIYIVNGARSFVEQIKKQGYLVALASSGSADHISATLRQIGLSDLLEPLPESLIPDTSKPAPDVLEQAARFIGLNSRDCLMIGDTCYDQQAAQRAKSGFYPVLTNPIWARQLNSSEAM